MPSITELLADKKASATHAMQTTRTLVTEAQAFDLLDLPDTEEGHKWLRGRITFDTLHTDAGEELRVCRLTTIQQLKRENETTRAKLPPTR